MNENFLKVLLTASITILFFTTGYLFLKKDQETFHQPLYNFLSESNKLIPVTNSEFPDLNSIERKQNEDEYSDWIIYNNDELGFRFKYPQEYGEFTVDIMRGDKGKIFRGGFPKFSNIWDNNKFFTIGGNTNDFVADRSIFFLDFINYSKDSEKYFDYKARDKKYQFEPVKTMVIDGHTVLIVNGKSYLNDRTSELLVGPGRDGGALINLPTNSEFKGLAIWNSDINNLSQEKFEKIISTLKFNR
jgi:hypothetical protein